MGNEDHPNVKSDRQFLQFIMGRKLLFAAQNERPDDVKSLLEEGAPPNARDHETGCTALMHAAEKNDLQSATILLENGGNPCLLNCRGESAITIAKGHGFKEMASLLESRKRTNTADSIYLLQRGTSQNQCKETKGKMKG